MKYYISNFKVDFYTFILLYARLSARSSFDITKRPSSSFGNPILLAISRQTDISLLSGRQYRKSSSLVPLNTKAPLDILIFGHNIELLVFPPQLASCPKHVVQYNRAIWKMLRELKKEFFRQNLL